VAGVVVVEPAAVLQTSMVTSLGSTQAPDAVSTEPSGQPQPVPAAVRRCVAGQAVHTPVPASTYWSSAQRLQVLREPASTPQPAGQLQVREPAVFAQVWLQPPLLAAHSLVSTQPPPEVV